MNLWLDLLNSDWHDHLGSGKHEDRLDNPAWLERYTDRWKDALKDVSPEEVRSALKNLRAILRRAVDLIVAKKSVPETVSKDLNSIFTGSPAVRRVVKAGRRPEIRLVPLRQNLASVISEIAAGFCEALTDGELSRIKVCANKDCLWVFYDRSKNRSRRWCEGDTGCGNLMKVRRFRARRKSA